MPTVRGTKAGRATRTGEAPRWGEPEGQRRGAADVSVGDLSNPRGLEPGFKVSSRFRFRLSNARRQRQATRNRRVDLDARFEGALTVR